jgi:hypothetical protein
MTVDLRQPEVKPDALAATCLDNGLKFITSSESSRPAQKVGPLCVGPVNLRENQQSESFPEPQGWSVDCGTGFILSWPEAKFWETATSDTGIRSQDQAGFAGQAIKINRASESQRCGF